MERQAQQAALVIGACDDQRRRNKTLDIERGHRQQRAILHDQHLPFLLQHEEAAGVTRRADRIVRSRKSGCDRSELERDVSPRNVRQDILRAGSETRRQ